MVIFGNICLALMGLGFVFLLGLLGSGPGRGDGGGAGSFMIFFLAPGMFLLFSTTYSTIVASGKLDGLGLPRGLQYFGVILACLCLTVLMAGAFLMHNEPAGQVPFGLRPFGLWASWAVPLLMIVVAFFWINAATGASVSFLRGTFLGLSAVGLTVGAILCVEGFLAMQSREAARVNEVVSRESSRDKDILEQTEKADPVKDFGSLLNQTSKWEKDPIRKLALSKVLSTGDQFPALLTNCFDHYYYYSSALVFLRDNDPPDPAGLAEPIKIAMATSAKHVRESIRDESSIRPDDFDTEAEILLAVADKYGVYKVDYVPSVREFRAALDEPRPKERTAMGQLNSKKTVDAWLSKHGAK